MKQGKKLNRRQKELLAKNGYDVLDWLLERQDHNSFTYVNRNTKLKPIICPKTGNVIYLTNLSKFEKYKPTDSINIFKGVFFFFAIVKTLSEYKKKQFFTPFTSFSPYCIINIWKI